MELTVTLEPADLRPEFRLRLFGPGDRNLKLIRDALDVQIFARDGQVKITGSAQNVARAAAVLRKLQRLLHRYDHLTDALVAEVNGLVDGGMRVKDACAQVIAANPGSPSRRALYDAVLRARD